MEITTRIGVQNQTPNRSLEINHLFCRQRPRQTFHIIDGIEIYTKHGHMSNFDPSKRTELAYLVTLIVCIQDWYEIVDIH